MYEIQSKNDFQAGVILSVRIPEGEVDKKALYTILAEPPNFILPFRHKSIDGQVEFIYQIGNLNKLVHLSVSGGRSPDEYAKLWFNILQPLLDCKDWFMDPYSFVLKSEYLYCDKNNRFISFLYIPSVRACSDYNDLKNMVMEVAKQNKVNDVNLENKILWAVQDFNPNEFLKILTPYKSNNIKEISQQNTPDPPPQVITGNPDKSIPIKPIESKITPVSTSGSSNIQNGEIIIDFVDIKQEKKEKSHLFGPKKEKPPKEPKEKSGFKKNKNQFDHVIIGGAAVNPNFEPKDAADDVPPVDVDNRTELDEVDNGTPKFRYIGNGDHPPIIEININENGIFTIGRFDTSVGIKQSDFEFDKKTKAVSRRHAVVERNANGHDILDLNSQAGTFINGQKLNPNMQYKLERGFRVSFGNLGADYIWEE